MPIPGEHEEIIRYDRRPGEHCAVVDLPEGPAVLLTDGVSVGQPVWPPDALGSMGFSITMRRVTAIRNEPCPHDGCERTVPMYEVSGGDGLVCFECPEHAFTWGVAK